MTLNTFQYIQLYFDAPLHISRQAIEIMINKAGFHTMGWGFSKKGRGLNKDAMFIAVNSDNEKSLLKTLSTIKIKFTCILANKNKSILTT